MEANHIPLIMDKVAMIVSEDMSRRFSNRIIVKIIVVLQIYAISCRSSGKFFNNHRS